MRSCAAYTSELNRRRLFSPSKPGPLGTTWHRVDRSHWRRVRRIGFAQQQFVGLAVPVGDEERVDARDDGPLEAHHEVLPVQAAPAVAPLVVAGVDDVLRAGESDLAVDDEQLAVVAQVGALELAPQRLHRQHEVPAARPSRRAAGWSRRYPGERSDAMWSSSTRTVTPRVDGGLERIEERCRRRGRATGCRTRRARTSARAAHRIRHRLRSTPS